MPSHHLRYLPRQLWSFLSGYSNFSLVGLTLHPKTLSTLSIAGGKAGSERPRSSSSSSSISRGRFWEERKRAAWLTLLWHVRAFCRTLQLFPGNISFNWSSPSWFVALLDGPATERYDGFVTPLDGPSSKISTCSGNELELGFALPASGLRGGCQCHYKE